MPLMLSIPKTPPRPLYTAVAVDSSIGRIVLMVPRSGVLLYGLLHKSSDLPAGTRWITVHPNGKDEKGVPVMIRESANEKGVYYVVGGAGGKLNHKKIVGVKSEAEYKAQQKEKRKTKKAEEKAKVEALRESGQLEAYQAAQSAIEGRARDRKVDALRRFVHDFGTDLLGLSKKLLTFNSDPNNRIEPNDPAYAKAELQFYSRMAKAIREKIKDNRAEILRSEETRQAAGIPALSVVAEQINEQVEQALETAQDKARMVENLESMIEEAKQKGDDTAEHEAQLEAATEELRAAQSIIEENFQPTLDILQDKKVRTGGGSGGTTSRDNAIANLVDSGTLTAETLKQAAMSTKASLVEGSGDRAVDRIMNEVHDLGSDRAVALARADLDKRATLLQEAAEAAESGDLVTAYNSWKQAEVISDKWQERVEKAANRPEDSQMNSAAYLDLVVDKVEEGRAKARQLKDLAARGITTVPDELQRAVISFEQQKRAEAKLRQLNASLRAVDEAAADLVEEAAENDFKFDSDYFLDKFQIDQASDKDLEAQFANDFKSRMDARINSNLLTEVEQSDTLMKHLNLTSDQLHAAMVGHVAGGAFAGFSNASLLATGDVTLDRDVINVLGVEGAAEVMARKLRQTMPDDKYTALLEGLEAYHSEEGTRIAQEALERSKHAYEVADSLAFDASPDPSDLAAMQALNDQRRAVLEDAMEDLGHTIGSLRATAQLIASLKSTSKKKVRDLTLPVDATAIDRLIQTMASNGVARDAYELGFDTTGKQRLITLKDGAIDQLVQSRYSQADLDSLEELQAIKRGNRDESGWLPAGIAQRTPSSLSGDGKVPQQFSIEPDLWDTPMGDLKNHIMDYVGSRLADGHPIEKIMRDLTSASMTSRAMPDPMGLGMSMGNEELPKERMDLVLKLAQALTPVKLASMDMSEIQKEKARRTSLSRKLADRFRQRAGLDAAPLHSQAIAEDTAATREALHRALAKHPIGVAAFTPPDRLNSQEQRALRNYFWNSVSPTKKDADLAAKKREQAEIDRKKTAESQPTMGMMGMDLGDMFNAPPDPILSKKFAPDDEIEVDDWMGNKIKVNARAWQQQKMDGDKWRDMYESSEDADPPAAKHAWDRYVQAHGNDLSLAYQSLQEMIRGNVLNEFVGHYNRLADEPIKQATVPLSLEESHLLGTVSADRYDAVKQSILNPRRSEMARVGKDSSGRFTTGSRTEAAETAMRTRQEAQRSLIQDSDLPEVANAPKRITIGDRAEAQLAGIVDSIKHTWNPNSKSVGDMFTISMGDNSEKGRNFYKQSRAVRYVTHQPKMGLFYGAGSGKSLTSLAQYTHLEDQGKVRRAIFAVPSAVQEQFPQEATRFLDPTKKRANGKTGYSWFKGSDAANQAERFAAYANQDHDMLVLTHQSIAGDTIDAIANHANRSHEETVEWFNGLSRKERQQAVGAAFKHMGWHGLDHLYVDEAQYIVNRQGKENSTMANVLDAIGDNSHAYVLGTGTPVKNDASEAFDYLSKVAPDQFPDRATFMRQYGRNTPGHKEALRRVIDRYFYQDRVMPDSTLTEYHGGMDGKPIPLSDHQKTAYKAAQTAYDTVTRLAARAKKTGTWDEGALVEAMRVLSPNSFAEIPEDQHLAKARSLVSAAGAMREAAYSRIINAGSFETNAKMQEVARMADHYRQKGQAGIVFARNLETVRELKRGLEAAGHRVGVITGSMSSAEKSAAATSHTPNGKPKRRADQSDSEYAAAVKAWEQMASADILLMTDAGNTGINLQRAKWMVQVDTPLTGPVHEQRTARMHRLGNDGEVVLHNLVSDTSYDMKAQRRLTTKKRTGHIFQTPSDTLDDTGLAFHVHQAYQRTTNAIRMTPTAISGDNTRAGSTEGQQQVAAMNDKRKRARAAKRVQAQA